MKNFIDKFKTEFTANLVHEFENNKELIDDYNAVKKGLIENTFVSKIYRALQLSDYLIYNLTKETLSRSFLENFLNKTSKYSYIEEYDRKSNNTITRLFDRYLDFKWYKNYRVLNRIETLLVPQALKSFFEMQSISDEADIGLDSKKKHYIDNNVNIGKNIDQIFDRNNSNINRLSSKGQDSSNLFDKNNLITPEAQESMKKLKLSILKDQKDWKEKEIFLKEVRKVETVAVEVVNLKKTVKCELEFGLILKGIKDNQHIGEIKHFGANMEFINVEGSWVVSSFSYAPMT